MVSDFSNGRTTAMLCNPLILKGSHTFLTQCSFHTYSFLSLFLFIFLFYLAMTVLFVSLIFHFLYFRTFINIPLHTDTNPYTFFCFFFISIFKSLCSEHTQHKSRLWTAFYTFLRLTFCDIGYYDFIFFVVDKFISRF